MTRRWSTAIVDVLGHQCTGTACSFRERCPGRLEICVPGCGGSPSGAFVD